MFLHQQTYSIRRLRKLDNPRRKCIFPFYFEQLCLRNASHKAGSARFEDFRNILYERYIFLVFKQKDLNKSVKKTRILFLKP